MAGKFKGRAKKNCVNLNFIVANFPFNGTGICPDDKKDIRDTVNGQVKNRFLGAFS